MEFQRDLSFRFPLTRGEDVRAVQQALLAIKIAPPCGTADGIYGPATADSVRAFQRGRALRVDGIVGHNTWRALFDAAANAPSPLVKSANAALPGAAQATLPSTLLPEGEVQPPSTELRVSEAQAQRVRGWMESQFGEQIRAALQGKPYDAALIYAIACEETAGQWLQWIDRLLSEEVLARCVFDASGDDPRSPRAAFPQNTAEFRARYGNVLTQELIDEANATRRLRGMSNASIVYKGYGIFQYDLQHIREDATFFTGKLWRNFDDCLDRLVRELDDKAARSRTLREAARRYNGQGARAEEYADQVMTMRRWFLIRATGRPEPAVREEGEPPAAPASVAAAGGGPYVAPDAGRFLGQVVGNGQCVAYVQEAAHAPHTSQWRRGSMVKGNGALRPGIAIATFDADGHYGNHTDGRSHAAIYLDQDVQGLRVYDQWRGQPVHERVIRFGGTQPVDDGDSFSVIV